MNYSGIYIRCFRALMDLEGWDATTNHPADAGQLTRYGISQLGYPDEDIANLTKDRAMFLYHRDYWLPLKCDAINSEGIAFQLLESSVHMDSPKALQRRATKLAQGALIIHGINVKYDGVMGPQTITALNNYKYKDSLLKWMNLLQGAALLVGTLGEDDMVKLIQARLKQLQTFARGWGRRIHI